MQSARTGQALSRVVVTGATGFIGSRLVKSFVAAGAPVLGLSHRKVAEPVSQFVPGDHQLRPVELCDLRELRDVFAPDDVVIHAAAVTSGTTPEQRRDQGRVNVESTRNVIEACRQARVRRLVHVSSIAAIGISPDPRTPADETTTFNLDGLGLVYNESKHHAERLVAEANDAGLATVTVNPGFALGPHSDSYRGGGVIARVMNRRVILCTDGGLSMVHVDDVVDGIHRIVRYGKDGHRYILSGENLTFAEIARTVCRAAGLQRRVVRVPAILRDLKGLVVNSLAKVRGNPIDLTYDRRYAYQFYCSEKAKRDLGYTPRAFEWIVADYLHWLRGREVAPVG